MSESPHEDLWHTFDEVDSEEPLVRYPPFQVTYVTTGF